MDAEQREAAEHALKALDAALEFDRALSKLDRLHLTIGFVCVAVFTFFVLRDDGAGEVFWLVGALASMGLLTIVVYDWRKRSRTVAAFRAQAETIRLTLAYHDDE